MTNASSFKYLITLLLLGNLFISWAAIAQELPAGATANKDKCLGYEMDYKKYPKSVIEKVQADMYQLYHRDADWKQDANRQGRPLNDGILGPVTWSWMQRFCNSFALATQENVVELFQNRSDEVAKFSMLHSDAAATLISKPFALWSATKTDICNLDVKHTLAQGSDDDLLALVRCYLEPPQEKAQPVVSSKRDAPHTIFALREDDFEAMAKQSTAIGLTDAIQNTLREKLQKNLFADESAAAKAMNPLLAELEPEQRQQVQKNLLNQLVTVHTYKLDDQALAKLDSGQTISDALFNELNSLSGKEYTDYKSFEKDILQKVAAAHKNPVSASSVQPPPLSPSSTDNASLAQSSVQPSLQTVNPTADINPARLMVTIKTLSEKKQLGFAKPIEIATTGSTAIPLDVITLLKDLKDIEYPSSDLLKAAIKVRILKASNICDLDKSYVFDKYFEEHFKEQKITEIQNLLRRTMIQQDKNLEKNLGIRDNKRNRGEKVYCRNIDEKYINYYYEPVLATTIEKLYSEPMPAYSAEPVLWSGGNEKCGCVPDEIQTMGYGIFPYWKTSKTPLEYDFSTFSRTAYFGLTADNGGKLKQIQGGAVDVLARRDRASEAFIREARRYDSKVDWIIEKDFGPENSSLNRKDNLEKFFATLRPQLIQLLSLRFNDAESRLRPLLSLGLVGHPLNGDGITLYFKNLKPENFPEFEQFFRALKYELKLLDEEKNGFHPIKNQTYLNIMISQNEYMDGKQTFNRENLEKLFLKKLHPDEVNKNPAKDTKRDKSSLDGKNLTIAEIQDELGTMLILIMAEPYYTSLDEVYAVTSSTDRAIIAPLMIGDYSRMDTLRSEPVDERKKRIAYLHESFGAGAFWPMVEFSNNSDGKNYDNFNEYIATHFSPGYAENYWNETLCAYRWQIIYVMNIWLCLAFVYLVVFFYLFPHRCRELPGILRLLEHPLTVLTIIIPPIMLWIYLQLMDSLFNFFNLSTLLCLLLLVLAIWAGVDAVKALQQRKPNRNLLQMVAFPVRNKDQKDTGENDKDVDENLDDDYK